MAFAWWMSASRALRGPLSGRCRPSSPRCAMDRPALQELDLSAPVSCQRQQTVPASFLLPRVERESSELSVGGAERVKKVVRGERRTEKMKKLVETERPMDDGPLLDCSYTFVRAKSFL